MPLRSSGSACIDIHLALRRAYLLRRSSARSLTMGDMKYKYRPAFLYQQVSSGTRTPTFSTRLISTVKSRKISFWDKTQRLGHKFGMFSVLTKSMIRKTTGQHVVHSLGKWQQPIVHALNAHFCPKTAEICAATKIEYTFCPLATQICK